MQGSRVRLFVLIFSAFISADIIVYTNGDGIGILFGYSKIFFIPRRSDKSLLNC